MRSTETVIKHAVYGILSALIFLGVGYFLLAYYLIDTAAIDSQLDNSNSIRVYEQKKSSIQALDQAVIDNKKVSGLEQFEYSKTDLEKLPIGNKSPFAE